jgi:hypothetical protein
MRISPDGNLLYNLQAVCIDNLHPGFLPDADVDVFSVRSYGEIREFEVDPNRWTRFVLA